MNEKIKLNTIKLNPDNPRKISPFALKKLMDSISEFTAMMYLRPIVVDENNVVLGGNQRLLALKTLKYKEIPVNWIKKADTLTEDEKKRFIVADNIQAGEWDIESLQMQYETDQLIEWGIDEFNFETEKEEPEPEKKPKQKQDATLITCPHCGEQFES